jgi:hypothetical protein
MSGRKHAHRSGKGNKEEKQQQDPLRPLLLQAYKERCGNCSDQADVRSLDTGVHPSRTITPAVSYHTCLLMIRCCDTPPLLNHWQVCLLHKQWLLAWHRIQVLNSCLDPPVYRAGCSIIRWHTAAHHNRPCTNCCATVALFSAACAARARPQTASTT